MAQVRVKKPVRNQIRWVDASLDQLIPREHRVRAVWPYVEQLDLVPLIHQGMVTLETVGQDGMRVRASAGSW